MAKAMVDLSKGSLTLEVAAERWAAVGSKKVHDLVERSVSLLLRELAIKTDYGAVSEASGRFKAVDVSRFLDYEDKMLLRVERDGSMDQRVKFTTTVEAAALIEAIANSVIEYKSHAVGSMISDIYVESAYAKLSVTEFDAKMAEFMTNLSMDADGFRSEIVDCTQKIHACKSYDGSMVIGRLLRDSIKTRIETMESRFAEETKIEQEIHLRVSEHATARAA